MADERKDFNVVQHPSEAEVGDYATIETLHRQGGKFYTMPDESGERNRALCDLPTTTWELFDASDPGYRRVE